MSGVSGASQVGLLHAMVTRVLLLFSISWLVGLTAPLFAVFSLELSGRDLTLLAGGLFLIYKADGEVHGKLEGERAGEANRIRNVFELEAKLEGIALKVCLEYGQRQLGAVTELARRGAYSGLRL